MGSDVAWFLQIRFLFCIHGHFLLHLRLLDCNFRVFPVSLCFGVCDLDDDIRHLGVVSLHLCEQKISGFQILGPYSRTPVSFRQTHASPITRAEVSEHSKNEPRVLSSDY